MELGLCQCRFLFRKTKQQDAAPAAEQPKKGFLSISDDAAELMRIVSDALRGFPEARQAVVAALEKSEKSEP